MEPKTITLYFKKGSRGNRFNVSYPDKMLVNSIDDLKSVVMYDNVSAEYEDSVVVDEESGREILTKNHRANEHFICSDNLNMDIDNDHSENPEEWKTPDDIRKAFPDVSFYAVPSKNHMKKKKGKEPRPKYHYYFPLSKVFDDVTVYAGLKEKVYAVLPFFDASALDGARYFDGIVNPKAEYYHGDICIDQYLERVEINPAMLPKKNKNSKSKVQNSNEASGDYDGLIKAGDGRRRDYLLSRAKTIMLKLGTKASDADILGYLAMDYFNHCEHEREETVEDFISNEDHIRIVEYARKKLDEEKVDPKLYQRARKAWKILNPDKEFKPEEDSPSWGEAVEALQTYEADGKRIDEGWKEYQSQKGACFDPEERTDVGQARKLQEVFSDLAYTDATKYLIYNGIKWEENDVKAQRKAQLLTEFQLKEARKMLRAAQDELNAVAEEIERDHITDKNDPRRALLDDCRAKVKEIESYRHHALTYQQAARIEAVLKMAKSFVDIDVTLLDHDVFLLNTPQGSVNLKTGDILEHDKLDYCTKSTGVAPSIDGSDLYSGFLNQITGGDKDFERYLQELAGMCAVGKVMQENLVIAYGEGGNGKSTLFNLWSKVLGDYSGSLPSEILTTSCRKNKRNSYAELRGKRLIIAAELEEGTRLDTATLKAICSTDDIKGEKKFKDEFEFTPSHTTVLFTNHLPKIGTFDSGTWSRIVVVPFTRTFRGKAGEIKNYADYLYKRCGGAVLFWIIEGAKAFISNDFKIEMPDCVKDAIAEYRKDNDWMSQFIEECCEVDKSYNVGSGALYQVYRDYCDRSGEYKRRQDDFNKALESKGYILRKTNKGKFVYGLRLNSTRWSAIEVNLNYSHRA